MRTLLHKKEQMHKPVFSNLVRQSASLLGQTQPSLQTQRPRAEDTVENLAPPIVNAVIGSSGQPLERETQALFTSRFGHDFSHVRVHTDEQAAASARAVKAWAYTVGEHIVFDAGQYLPGTASGNRVLAHELTHVIQQAGLPSALRLTIAQPHDAYEQAADESAQAGRLKTPITNNRLQQKAVQRISIGSDGPLTPARTAIVLKAGAIAESFVLGDAFSKKWKAFWEGKTGALIKPQPTLEQYQKAVKEREVNDMDTSTNEEVKATIEAEKEFPLERQIPATTKIGTTKTYMREFAIDQGVDSVAHLLIHESLHGAGISMGSSQIFEPFLHQFEGAAGFPMSVGGADIVEVKQARSGDYDVSVKIGYKLYTFEGEDLPENLEIQIVSATTGEVVSDEQPDGTRKPARQKIASKVGTGKWEWRARYPGWQDYVIRIHDTDNDVLLESRDITTNPHCMRTTSGALCDDNPKGFRQMLESAFNPSTKRLK